MDRWGDPAPSPNSCIDSLRMPTAKEIKWVLRLIARMRTRIRRYSREKRFSEVRNMMHMIQYEADDATRTDLVDRHIQMHAMIRSLDSSESAGLDRPIRAVKRNVEALFGEGHLPPDL